MAHLLITLNRMLTARNNLATDTKHALPEADRIGAVLESINRAVKLSSPPLNEAVASALYTAEAALNAGRLDQAYAEVNQAIRLFKRSTGIGTPAFNPSEPASEPTPEPPKAA